MLLQESCCHWSPICWNMSLLYSHSCLPKFRSLKAEKVEYQWSIARFMGEIKTAAMLGRALFRRFRILSVSKNYRLDAYHPDKGLRALMTLSFFAEEYVTCHTCKSPDTLLERDVRLYFLRCRVCLSRCSVAAIKSGFQAVTNKRARIRAKAGPWALFGCGFIIYIFNKDLWKRTLQSKYFPSKLLYEILRKTWQ